MFSKAYEIASQFTNPVVFSMRFFDKSVDCVNGAFIILNRDGWIVTVAHLFNPYFASQKHKNEISAYDEQILKIENDTSLSDNQKKQKKSEYHSNPKWITNYSFWWGKDGVEIKDLKVLQEGDLVIGRLEPFDPKLISQYPILKNPKDLKIGTSLCKLGYPFHDVKISFDEITKKFELAPGTLPIPVFPLEGIYTRNGFSGRSKDKKYEIKFIETSSPGLRGQSGGPIFDVHGTVWGVQSQTAHLPLGFNPDFEINGKKIEEYQFLNVGLGIHPELLVKYLRDNNVDFQMSAY